ncbi:MAG: MFS transporter [Limisphaerales bacterium]
MVYGIIRWLMTGFRNKWVYFAIEALNAFACSFYFNYIFFFLRDFYHFGNRENLAFSAFHGFIYAVASWQLGKIIDRIGQVRALKYGFVGMAFFLLLGLEFSGHLIGLMIITAGWTISMCLIWPAIESLVSLNEPVRELPRMVGIYNAVWAASSAISYFVGGAIFQHLGSKALFLLPPAINIFQLILTLRFAENNHQSVITAQLGEEGSAVELKAPEKAVAEKFLKMAWLANPLAYVAMNTFLAAIPQIARQQNLTPAEAGLFCSIWMFMRFFAFVLLWRWDGWHYRFFYLFKAFLFLIAGFIILLISKNLWMLAVAQVFFGWAVGLIYYSSLYYAMDIGKAGASHGGLHEAAIGVGIFLGPAIGSGSLYLFPDRPNIGIYLITTLLTVALLALVRINFKKR